MTKVIILGEDMPKTGRKIELISYVSPKMETTKGTVYKPHEFENIELICRDYGDSEKDLLFAYNKDRNRGILYLGHFNDGIV